MKYTSPNIDINEAGQVWPIPVGSAKSAMFGLVHISGTFSAAVLTVVYRLDPAINWQTLIPATTLTASNTHTTVPLDVEGRIEIGLKVTTAEGSAGEVRAYCVTT